MPALKKVKCPPGKLKRAELKYQNGRRTGNLRFNPVALHAGLKQIERAAEDLGEEIARNETSIVQNGNLYSGTMYLSAVQPYLE